LKKKGKVVLDRYFFNIFEVSISLFFFLLGKQSYTFSHFFSIH
jgi:hypothetical protein